jgi:hypothetical protein
METGVDVPSESVILCTLTEKETTLGRGASVPRTYTEPVCSGVVPELVLGALPLPALQPAIHAVAAMVKNTRNPWIHFIKPPASFKCLDLCYEAP